MEQKHNDLRKLGKYRRFLYNNPRLRHLFFELTDQCNLNCIHCGSRCTPTNTQFLPFLAVQKTLEEVSSIYDSSEIMINLTGGEPLLHPLIIPIIQTAHKCGFPVGITTNGTLITEDVAYCLKAAGLDSIAVSIDGMSVSHNTLRRSTSAFQKAINGIQNLKRVGLEPQVITVIHKNNLAELEDLYEYLLNLGIYSWRVVNIEPIGRAFEHEDIILNREELEKVLNFIRDKRAGNVSDMDVTYGCSHFVGFEKEKEVRDFYFQCGAGTQIASIMVNGDIGACLDIERNPKLAQGNIYRDSFVEVWECRFRTFRRDRSRNSHVCQACPFGEVCQGDSAHTWNFDTEQPNYCIHNLR